jgi:hypothetical protein
MMSAHTSVTRYGCSDREEVPFPYSSALWLQRKEDLAEPAQAEQSGFLGQGRVCTSAARGVEMAESIRVFVASVLVSSFILQTYPSDLVQ